MPLHPEDLSALSVYLEGEPMGQAAPFVISTHVHPQVPPPRPPTAPPSGIDYLGLVLAASTEKTPGAISYRFLAGEEDER